MRTLCFNVMTGLGRFQRQAMCERHINVNKLNIHISPFCSVASGNELDEEGANETPSIESSNSSVRLALKLMYFGNRYGGMHKQAAPCNTIEEHLFKALIKANLIEDIRSCRYGKNSRTDKGVSALSQIVSFDVHDEYFSWQKRLRQNFRSCETDEETDLDEDTVHEYILPAMARVNSDLPFDIKVWAWAVVPADYFPRKQRYRKTYKYWFFKENLDLQLMSEACKRYKGTHDFRNFCKRLHRTHYVGHIWDASVEVCKDNPDLCVFTVTGSRFLWHQIRYMVSILSHIGRKEESLEIIDELLDVEKNPCKPHYPMFPALSLCLYNVEADNIKWNQERSMHNKMTLTLEEHWRNSVLMAALMKGALDKLKNTEFKTDDGHKRWSKGEKHYHPIMGRKKGKDVEFARKRHEKILLRKRMMDPDYELNSDDKKLLFDNLDEDPVVVDSDEEKMS